MHICKICNYITNLKHNYNIHIKCKKHLELEIKFIENKKKNEKDGEREIEFLNFNRAKYPYNLQHICINCNKTYEYASGLSRHRQTCISKVKVQNDPNIINSTSQIEHQLYHKLEQELDKIRKEKEMIEKEFQYKLEIQQLKLENEMNKKEKEFENQLLKIQINTSNTSNTSNITNNTTIHNNVKISKIQYLNLNFRNVIDMNTFLTNYSNNYGLTSDQTKILLENSENDGVTACIAGIIHYLKKSAVKQYKDIKGEDVTMENIILPFLLSDKCVRDHFEKSSDNKWDKTTMIDNIQKIISITNNQVFKHHNKYMNFNGKQKKRIINGLLKQSGYDMVSKISNHDFYKNKPEKPPIMSSSSSKPEERTIIISYDDNNDNDNDEEDKEEEDEDEDEEEDDEDEDDEEEDEEDDEEEDDEEEDDDEDEEEDDEKL
jgi:hypothetical protein